MEINKLTEIIIGASIEVHKALGPGLLESAYEECLCHEFRLKSLRYDRQSRLPLTYKGIQLDCGYIIDLFVEERVIVELKTIDKLSPIHDAQLLTYMKLANISVGLLINFNVPVLRNGIRRKVLNHVD